MKPLAPMPSGRTCLAHAIRALPQPSTRRCFSASSAAARSTKEMKARSKESLLKRRPGAAATPALPVSRNVGSTNETYYNFRILVNKHLNGLLEKLRLNLKSPQNRGFGFTGQRDLQATATRFSEALDHSFALAGTGFQNRDQNPLFWSLRSGFVRGNVGGLNRELKYAFRSFAGHTKFASPNVESLAKLTDLSNPVEWFPATRAMHRTVHVHVGPTNSGKTYNALKALESARTGVYAGPLRLLAHEVYSRMLAKGRACALITGEEQRYPEDVDHFISSCTVEMTPLNSVVDVAVIDEIQMMGDPDRGWAWTQAFIGIQAREVHVCGEERTVELLQRLCAKMSDKCIVHRYQRLSPLAAMENSLEGDHSKLQKGDAMVAFSRVGLHALKRGIEQRTGKRCAIVYGSLPPETRAEQAALFNDPDNEYDYIVASDAIGMGLNLDIRRVIFDSLAKFDGGEHRFLEDFEIKQIGGRAGRFRTAAQAISNGSDDGATNAEGQKRNTGSGMVTCMEDHDIERIKSAFTLETPPLKAAGILPPAMIIEKFSTYFQQGTPLSHILLKMREMAKSSSDYFLCHFDDWIEMADMIEEYPMPISDRLILLAAPCDRATKEFLQSCAKCISDLKNGHLLDLTKLDLDLLDEPDPTPGTAQKYLGDLERLHKSLVLYLWLSYRYSGVFSSRDLAFHVKGIVEEKIGERLEKVDFRPSQRTEHKKQVQAMIEKQRRKKEKVLPGIDVSPEVPTSAPAEATA